MATSSAATGPVIFGNQSQVPPMVLYIALGSVGLFALLWLLNQRNK